MQEMFLPLHAPLTPECDQKVNKGFFLKVVMLHNTLKRLTHTTTCKQKFCPYWHPFF